MFKKVYAIIISIMISCTFFTQAQAADVYVIRGLFGFLFPNIMYPLAEDLRKEGHNVFMTDWYPITQVSIVRSALQRKRLTNGKNKVVIIGHSLGGNAATNLSEMFKDKDLTIDYMAVIDAPMPQEVKNSVKVLDNFYQFNDFRNPILNLEDSKKTKMTQFNFRGKVGLNGGPGVKKSKRNHFTIATDPFVIDRIKKQIDDLK